MRVSELDMRDAFFNELYHIAKKNRNVILLSDDFGAPSLDKFRQDLKNQYINAGIAEQNMVSVAAGLALSGKIVYIYAISPFITLRCYEQIKIDLCTMNLSVTALGVGAGYAYDSAGPSHHSIDDIAVMRVLPNITIYSPSDSIMASALAKISYELSGPKYIRFDRGKTPLFYEKNKEDFQKGFSILKQSSDLFIVSTGIMVNRAFEISAELKKHSIDAGIIDFYRLKPIDEKSFLETIKKSERVVTLEEHLINGGIGSILSELFSDAKIKLPLQRIAINEIDCIGYTNRHSLQTACGLDLAAGVQKILKW